MDLTLNHLRAEINKIDLELAPLLNKRISLVKQIKVLKEKLNLNILDKLREDELNKLLTLNGFDNEELITLFNHIRLFYKELQRPNKVALIGKNLTHSFSSLVHEIISKVTKLNYEFSYLDINNLDKKEVYNLLNNFQYKGFFITMPYKKELIGDQIYLSNIAHKIGVINLLYLKNNLLIGDNTDYYGFIKAFDKKREFLTYKPFILGDGASSQMIRVALLDLGYKEPIIVSLVPNSKNKINYEMFNYLQSELVINATPVGMYPNINESLNLTNIENIKYYFDLIYNPKITLTAKKLNKDALIDNGLEMLIYQAIKGIELIYNNKFEEKIIKKIYNEVIKEYAAKIK